ncbi:MAG: sulfite exporter TauE/SafE family protein [Pirellulaceae bacterium]|nr:sulfite exporter TauE/SafE family protein [Pirellulaceae bacterium]
MLEWPLVFMAGLLGSSHCIGMCGGFALALGSSSPTLAANLSRQLVYTSGRVFTYSVLGTLAAFGGWRMAAAMPRLVNLPAVLAIVAGGFLVYQGLRSAGWLGRPAKGSASGCLAGSIFSTFLTSPGWSNAFLAGMLTGLLPCGLLYGMLALAASTRNLWLGGAAMALFGLGTAPVMVLAGSGGSLLTLAGRRHLLRIAAWCVVLTGLISIARGCGFLTLEAALVDPSRCPFCP